MNILVLGAGGFIGHHVAEALAAQGHMVHGVDLKMPEFSSLIPFERFDLADLSNPSAFAELLPHYDECYQFAADMGGAGYIFTGDNDLSVMTNSAAINLNVVRNIDRFGRTFFASSACVYPAHNQATADEPLCTEDSAYPAAPDSEYGWEKLFSERLYIAAARNAGAAVRIGRYHNVYGPEGTYKGGREKAPAAMCRKVHEAENPGSVQIWGDGEQTRSFLYISDAVEATIRFMRSDFEGPINIGSEEMVTINALAQLAAQAACKTIRLEHISGPLGVRGRRSFNDLIRAKVGWEPKVPLVEGIKETYQWIAGRNS